MISVILPVLNEAQGIGEVLRRLRDHRPGEVIVVDGGSTDDTCRLARGADLILHGPRGRAAQMNLGAAHARGDVLLFLHADCVLERGALDEAARILQRRRVAAGCFRMCVPAEGLLYRSIEAFATARVRWTGLAYGDQGLFVTRDTFRAVGGFPAVRFLEDVLLSRALRRRGRVAVASRRVWTSPRRWQRAGLIRQTLRNWTLTALAAAGVPPDRLAEYYPVVR